jgi:hypothetical protein
MLDTRGLVIGELAVREKLLSRDQLEDIIAIQERAKFSQPLGALMLEKKYLSKAQLDSLLRRQKQAIVDYEKSLSVSGLFGRIAIQLGMITEHQLADAIRRQLSMEADGKRRKIGQILLSMKALDSGQFWRILFAQGGFKCGACGHELDEPKIEKTAIVCEKCGKPALTLDEG